MSKILSDETYKQKKINHEKLIKIISEHIAKFPDINFRQAKKITSYLLSIISAKDKNQDFENLFNLFSFLQTNISECEKCHNFLINGFCDICENSKRKQKNIICVVENLYELWRMKEIGEDFGYDFHVIGGIISINTGFLPSDLNLNSLVEKIKNKNNEIKEVIIAINKSYDGILTCNYIASFLQQNFPEALENGFLKITTLADGLPSGVANFDFIDKKTLQTSLETRRNVLIFN